MAETGIPLSVVKVEEPCAAAWDAMRGDQRARFCQRCNLSVHNLSAMSNEEAKQLLDRSHGRLCVRYECADHGMVKTLDYASNGGRRSRFRGWAAIAAISAVVATAIEAAIFRSRSNRPPAPGTLVVGMLAPTPKNSSMLGKVNLAGGRTPAPPPLRRNE
jgi:hypothetical protein